jgi:hypothetical protein
MIVYLHKPNGLHQNAVSFLISLSCFVSVTMHYASLLNFEHIKPWTSSVTDNVFFIEGSCNITIDWQCKFSIWKYNIVYITSVLILKSNQNCFWMKMRRGRKWGILTMESCCLDGSSDLTVIWNLLATMCQIQLIQFFIAVKIQDMVFWVVRL